MKRKTFYYVYSDEGTKEFSRIKNARKFIKQSGLKDASIYKTTYLGVGMRSGFDRWGWKKTKSLQIHTDGEVIDCGNTRGNSITDLKIMIDGYMLGDRPAEEPSPQRLTENPCRNQRFT